MSGRGCHRSPSGETEGLRILHVLDHVDNTGNGIVNVAVDLACAQAQAGHRVTVASDGGGLEGLLVAHGVRHRRLVRRDSAIGRVGLVLALIRIVRSVRPDVVNAHRPYAVVAARLARLARRFALVATDHNEFEARGRLLAAADLIVAVSEGAAASLAAGGVPRSKIRVVHNGPLDGARQAATGTGAGRRLRRPAIVTVAGLVARKGGEILLEAFQALAAEHPEANLYYVGDGPERGALERRAVSGMVAGRVHVEGFSPDPGEYLRGADIFVLPSLREPFGLAALEARAAGCAVVVSEIDGLPEVVDGGRAGLLVPPGDPVALARALGSLLSSPRELARWRERARANLPRFTATRMAQSTDAVYREAMAISIRSR